MFGAKQGILDFDGGRLFAANNKTLAQVDIYLCTSGIFHLVDKLRATGVRFNHVSTSEEPKNLGFYCHTILKDYMGDYDYYCHMDDDVHLQDPFFFNKLRWFNQNVGNEFVLQPNRFEISANGPLGKLYVDGTLNSSWTTPHRDLSRLEDIELRFLDEDIRFCAAKNPHSAGFFLNQEQFRTWSSRPYFLDRDSSLIGPIESAASLGILKCFKLYKAAPERANFLEIFHADARYIDRVSSP